MSLENFHVHDDRVIVSLDPVDKDEETKIILLEGSSVSNDNYVKCLVLHVGDKCTQTKPGDIGLRNVRAGASLTYRKEKYWMLKEDQLIGHFSE